LSLATELIVLTNSLINRAILPPGVSVMARAAANAALSSGTEQPQPADKISANGKTATTRLGEHGDPRNVLIHYPC
jgi:hypothetical protein